MHNLSTVINFEIVRMLKKKSFWIMAFGFPIMIACVFGIIYLSNKATSDAEDKLKDQQFSIVVTDDSKLVNTQLLQSAKISTTSDKATGINDVKTGKIDSYIYYPADLSKDKIEVYGKNVGIFDNTRYNTVALALLNESVQATVSPQVKTVLQKATSGSTTIYRDGKEYDPLKEMILPGIFLILFYLLIAFFGNQMLTSTTEEKENRVIEMILTTIEARTLIVGKIISLIALAFLQGLLVALPIIIGYFLFRGQLNLPDFDMSNLPINWTSIGIGALLFALSFLFFTGVLVLIGASMPTAKEAGGFISFVYILLFGPLYAVTLFISMPDAPIVRFLSFFPLTAPIPLLLRNAVGNLEIWEVLLSSVILLVSAAITLVLAVRVFRYGALEYSRKVSLKELFARK